MMSQQEPRKRGRPKTFDREHVTRVAMMAFWQEGPEATSLNDVCKRAEVSRPSLYREFGGEDGLLAASLQQYFEIAFVPIFKTLESQEPFQVTLENFTAKMTNERAEKGIPEGCLLVKIRSAVSHIGPETGKAINSVHAWKLDAYAKWIDRCKENGTLKSDTDTKLLAVYIDAQMNLTMMRDARGDDRAISREILRLALVNLV
jgi:AcrR family transcriptional regulator